MKGIFMKKLMILALGMVVCGGVKAAEELPEKLDMSKIADIQNWFAKESDKLREDRYIIYQIEEAVTQAN